MKKNWLIAVLLILVVALGGIYFLRKSQESENKNTRNTDAIKFKEEYEALNGKVNENNGKNYRSISIPEDNPFVYKEAKDIVNMIENEETFVVYFGYDSCPWCRSVVPTLIDVAKDLNIARIYYVDVKEIRDTMKLNSQGKPETTKEGTEGYYRLIQLLEPVLSDYELQDTNGKTVKAGEKRIYAPNVISVVDGVPKELETGISELQTDGYMELTEEMKNDTYNQFQCVLKCMNEKKDSCSIQTSC